MMLIRGRGKECGDSRVAKWLMTPPPPQVRCIKTWALKKTSPNAVNVKT